MSLQRDQLMYLCELFIMYGTEPVEVMHEIACTSPVNNLRKRVDLRNAGFIDYSTNKSPEKVWITPLGVQAIKEADLL